MGFFPTEEQQCERRGHDEVIQTNRKGRRFKECQRCGAFLGWID